MKRFVTGIALTIALTAAAHAHTLDGDHGMIERLWHELLGWHHLPLTMVLVIVGVVGYLGLRARNKG